MASVSFWVVIASVAVSGQQPVGSANKPPQAPATSVLETTYESGSPTAWRRVQTRTASGDREVLVETDERPVLDSRWSPVQEITTEITRSGSKIQTRRDVTGFAYQSQRQLVERTESERTVRPDGSGSATENMWVPDINGRLALKSRQIETTRSTAGTRQIDRTLLMTEGNEPLRERERTQYTEREIKPGVIRYDNTHSVRDLNGRWQPVEMRSGEVRESGSSERVEEELIHGYDLNGNPSVQEKRVTRRTEKDGREDVVIDTYAAAGDGAVRGDGRLGLSQRVRRTTTARADGGQHTVEEVEERSPTTFNDSLRVVRRTVTIVRNAGPDRRVTERQIFELDVNGRMRQVATESGESSGK